MPDARENEIEGFLRSHGPFEVPPRHPCGARIGDWKILAFLGRGGSSEVYRAENTVTGLIAALKILYRSDDSARERFKREVRLVAEMRSAAFPKFYGAGECDGQFYLAEELLEPASLPMRDAAVARFILGVCAGVDKLHRLGFVHRDIKPGNVMVRPATGESVLIDMGLAKGIDETPQTRNETLSVVDGHAVGVGTPGFSAPEQFAGGRISAATDIHAIGMLANACFGGKPPRVWTTIIRRSTSSIPEQRYATVEEFERAVRNRWRGRRIAVVCAVLGGALLGVFVWATSINGGDFWLRQAWLSGRQLRSIQPHLGDEPQTDIETDIGDRPYNVDGDRPQINVESDGDRPRKVQQPSVDRPQIEVGDRPYKVQEINQKQTNNIDNARQASKDRPQKAQQKDIGKTQPIDGDRPPKAQGKPKLLNGDRPQKVDDHDGDRPREVDGDRPFKVNDHDGDRPQEVNGDELLGAVWDVFNDPLSNRGAEDVKPKPSPSQEPSQEQAQVQKEVTSEGTASLLRLGKMEFENGKVFMRIALDGRDIRIQEDVHLERPRKIVIEGPGRIVASISGVKGVEIELGKHVALINLTDKPYPKSGIRYILHGACYLNFKNLDSPRNSKNIWVDDLSGKGRPLIRYHGIPDSYDEAAKEQKKISIELMKKGQLDWI